MKKIGKITVLTLIFIMIVSSSVLAYGQVDQIKIGISVDENSLNPYTYTSGNGLHLTYLVYDCLIHLDENLELQPWLAESYTVSEDMLTYTFKLKEGVKWHDGEPLTAEDVKFTFEYIMEHPKSRFTRPSKAITSITVKDEYTVEFVLDTPKVNFLIQPIADMPILPKHIWENIDNPDEYDGTIGSGPYKLITVEDGQYYQMEANDDYFMGKPVAKEIIIPIIKDQTALFTALTAGQIDATNKELAPELQNQFEGSNDIKLAKGPGFSTTLLQINNEIAPFNDVEFRQAIAYAIDSEEIVNSIMLGVATEGSMGFIHPSSSYYNKNVANYSQDFEKAKQLISDLGYEDSNGNGIIEIDGEDMELELLVYANNPIRIRIAELVQEWLLEIGIGVEISAMDMNTVDDLVWPGFDVAQGRNYDMSMWGWGSSMQTFPQRIVELLATSTDIGTVNIGAHNNEEFDAIATKLIDELDPDKRKEMIMELQLIASESVGFVPLYYPDYVFAYNASVYDGWVFVKGLGIINKLSLITDEVEVVEEPAEEPAEPTSSDADEDHDNDILDDHGEEGGNQNLIILALVFLAAIGFIIFRKMRAKM